MNALLSLLQKASGTGWIGLSLLFLAIFLGSLAFAPRNLIILAGGFLFGWAGLPVIVIASIAAVATGATAVRFVFRRQLLRLSRKRRSYEAVLRAIDQEGWRVIALLALAGPFPMTIQILLFGLTGTRIAVLTAVASLAHMPQAILFVYLGTFGGSMLRDGPPAALQLGLLAVGLVTLGLVTWLITVRARAMLQDRIVGST